MVASTSIASLAPLYYQDNFEQLCRTVQAQYDDLLSEQERSFLDNYFAAGLHARCLYVRLVSRRGPLFRSEQLNYPELGDLASFVSELIEQELVETVTVPETDDLLSLLRKSELLDIYAQDLGGWRGGTRSELLARLVETLDQQALIERWRRWNPAGSLLLKPLFGESVEVLQLLFFGNKHQSLTDFVLSDLGLARYEDYPLDREYRLFQQRCEIEDYQRVAVLRDRYYEALESDEEQAIEALVEPLLERGPIVLLEQRRNRLRNRVARQLERYQSWHSALLLYECSSQHPSRERRARILYKLGEYGQALLLCREMEAEPWCEAEIDFLPRFIGQLEKKLGRAAARLPGEVFVEEHIVLPCSDQVEHAAVAHYEKDWQEVHFVENSLANGVFGLAFWEQIFLPLPGAFVNPYQGAPLDMFSADFYQRRSQPIETRLLEIEAAGLKQALLAAYDDHLDITNHWVNWRNLSRPLLEMALDVIPLQHWIPIWRRILFDPRANRSGFPDLVALDGERGYSLIEIKGPGDRLQANQKRWLRFFGQQGIPAQVTWVQWSND